ncbi:hypothetical protein P3L10_022644 [Capsicum annuum]
MLKAQEIILDKYHMDIMNVMTLSSLSLKIFRQNYLDDEVFHIHLPTRNQDTFIRRGFYGGHVDVYKPYGENLYYYDVNSLYPYIMVEYPIPCGIPASKNNLKSTKLDSLFGFLEAYVVCPTYISRPFLPYKNQTGTFLFNKELIYSIRLVPSSNSEQPISRSLIYGNNIISGVIIPTSAAVGLL